MNNRNDQLWVFTGTIGRLPYFLNGILAYVLMAIISAIAVDSQNYFPLWVAQIICLIGFIPIIYLLVAIMANCAKRIRDVRGEDKPVWTWLLALFVPILSVYIAFQLLFKRGLYDRS